MKLNSHQLARQLNEQLAPVYILCGDEPLLLGEAADLIRHACRKAGSEERQVFHVERGFDWSLLYAASQSMSLFAQQRLLELRLNGNPGDDGNKALQAYLESPPDDTTLLVTLPKLDKNAAKTKWAKTLIEHRNSRFVQIWPIESHQLPDWMRQRLSTAGLQASPEALDLLAERVEGNLLAAAQEIEKLKLFDQGGQIELETIRQVVADSARFDVFGLVDAVLQGDAGHALRILNGLRGEGVEAPIVLWAIARELRGLTDMAQQIERGIPADKVFASQRPPIWDKRRPLLSSALKRHPADQWAKWLRQAQLVDEQIKGLQPGSPWDTLALIAAGAAQRGSPVLGNN
ncbi:MAG: DNA polymerase III subunit delta [Pseudomonadaceae bacterium]|nr:MAG: DNA polymerase III subunit delta [Pseudomonadaceae bacterium]